MIQQTRAEATTSRLNLDIICTEKSNCSQDRVVAFPRRRESRPYFDLDSRFHGNDRRKEGCCVANTRSCEELRHLWITVCSKYQNKGVRNLLSSSNSSATAVLRC